MFSHTYPIIAGSAIEAFQAAIFFRLSTDIVLTQLAPGGVHDLIVSDAANDGRGITFPYVVLGGATETMADRLTSVAFRVSIPIDIYSQYEGSFEIAQIARRLGHLLHRRERDVPVQGYYLNMLVCETTQIFREADNMMHGQFRFGGLLAPMPMG